ncbi:hypothetical protein BDV25DRAFT_153810 [Aspergillus avenaceus]|uniref:N-acetyltransferase domain-containing protein n=1 Tax=Aspergillus avenaceus TaxID=36643 RepID=A0A5N6TWJ6_ASPAV|nr:hypothetical protein BDV25DRAFT_153810 [Aspergillus avenaceus]
MPTPHSLTPRFEIRPLGPEHQDWANAIVIHSNVFCSPVWPNLYPSNKTARAYEAFTGSTYLIQHQISSGVSFGVFDTEYKFRHASSAATGGKLLWNLDDDSATADQLLEQMDFPLVSVALSYNGATPLDLPRVKPLFASLPLFPHLLKQLDESDSRGKIDDHTGVLMRNGTSTRADYEGFGLMKRTAHWLMGEAKALGFKGVEIPCFHDAVIRTWSNPPSPFKGEVVASLNVKDFVVDEGTTEVACSSVDQALARIYVTLV